MSRRHKKHKRKKQGDVELNLAAMLEMAFQLLTFFILTFKPAPVEGQVNLRLPPPMPVTKIVGGQAAGSNESNPNPVQGLNTLMISVFSRPDGSVRQIGVGESQMGNVAALDRRLNDIFADKGNAFDQVIIAAGSNLSYEALMSVIDVCTRQTLPTGEKLSKLSFAEQPE